MCNSRRKPRKHYLKKLIMKLCLRPHTIAFECVMISLQADVLSTIPYFNYFFEIGIQLHGFRPDVGTSPLSIEIFDFQTHLSILLTQLQYTVRCGPLDETWRIANPN